MGVVGQLGTHKSRLSKTDSQQLNVTTFSKAHAMETSLLLQSLQFELPRHERAALERQLTQHINYLINHDFSCLLQLLYTVDVHEQQLKAVLLQQPAHDAAHIITDLILQRQQQKTASLHTHRNRTIVDDDDERW